MDFGGRWLYNRFDEEVDELIVEPESFVEAREAAPPY